MLKTTQSKWAVLALVASAPIMLFFQNCAQPGSAAASSTALNSAASTSDALVIVPPTNSDTVSVGDPAAGDDNITSGKGSVGSCSQLVISDMLLKVLSISSNASNPNEASFAIVDSDQSISLEKLNLKIKASQSGVIKDLTLVLNAQGNKILTADNVVVDLQTPVNQQSVVKVSLAQSYSIEAGQTYNLVLSVNPNELMAGHQGSCLFKPLIQTADLSSAP